MMRSVRSPGGLLALSIIVGMLSTGNLCAQSAQSDSPRDQARSIGGKALAALDAREYAEAETLFEQALQLYDAPTLRLGRARAAVGTGRWLQALEDFREVMNSPAVRGETAAFAAARLSARAEFEALSARVPQLVIVVSGQAMSIAVDGKSWPAASGERAPVDPGAHQIVAQFPSGVVKRTVEAREGGTLTAQIDGPGANAAATNAVGLHEDVAGQPFTATTTRDQSRQVLFTTSAVATGVLVVAAVVTGIVALNKRGDYNEHNTPGESRTTKEQLREQAHTWALVNTGLTSAAVLGAGITGFLWLTDEPASGHPSAFASPPAMPRQLPGLSWGISGRF
jgi:hypothetical protein